MTVRRWQGPLVVVGDVLLDVDTVGSAHRLCPDSAAPVLDEVEEHHRPGGAGLAAALAAARRTAVVHLVAAVAADDDAERLRALLAEHDVRLHALDDRGHTTVKHRVRAGDTTVARIDRGGSLPDGGADAEVLRLLGHAGAVLVSDYGRGVTSLPWLRAALTRAATRTPVVWDPHPRGGDPIAGAALVTPNAAEAQAVLGTPVGPDVASAATAARTLRERWSARTAVITLGDRGALLVGGPGAPTLVPAASCPDGDPCGAGDAFASAAALSLLEGHLPSRAVEDAVRAAGAFVAAGGATGWPASAAPPEPAVTAPVVGYADIERLGESLRQRHRTVVATGGCFDLLHPGHVATLEAARATGDALVVLVNSDASVRALKGPTRPLVRAHDRAQVLAGLRSVDAVVIFDEETPIEALTALRPDVWVKGGDYAEGDLPEAEVVRSWGGTTVVTPYLSGHSTTHLVESAHRARVS